MIKLIFHFSIRLYWKGIWRRKRMAAAQSTRLLLADVCNDAIQQLAASRSKSTLDNYQTALRSLLAYAGKDIGTEQLTPSLMEGYQHWLTERGITLNTISCYMRSLRSLFSRSEVSSKVPELFKSVYKGNTRTDKRSLPFGDLQMLSQLPLPIGTPLCFARDIFLFSVYALGMPFVDVAFLRKKQIADGYITYYRHKTGQRVRVKVEQVAQQIITRYHREDSEFVFPILHEGTMEEYHIMRSRYNRQLRRL